MKFIFFKIPLGYAIVFLLTMCESMENKDEAPGIKNDSTVYKLIEKNQILLTNNIILYERDGMFGASSFLIRVKNAVYAVTAKHLLGEAGGIVPEIEPRNLKKHLFKWLMFPRVTVIAKTDTVIADPSLLNYDSLDKDILLLNVNNKDHNSLPLTVTNELPNVNDTLYIIGCPYSEENCKQNVYKSTFVSYDREVSMIISETKQKIELAGFSGAPLLDAKGRVVGVVTSGWEDEGRYFIGATFIKEIDKIK